MEGGDDYSPKLNPKRSSMLSEVKVWSRQEKNGLKDFALVSCNEVTHGTTNDRPLAGVRRAGYIVMADNSSTTGAMQGRSGPRRCALWKYLRAGVSEE